MPNGFTAACVSSFGLVRALGTTLPALISEVDTGIMVIGSSDEWIKRTKAKFPAGPTGPWVNDWWAVWNYLQYGAGACVIGGTGAVWGTTMDDYSTGNPLDSYSDPINVIFGLDTETMDIYSARSSHKHATRSALLRGNVFAIVGCVGDHKYLFRTGDTGPSTCIQNQGTFNQAFCESWVNGFTYSVMQNSYGLHPAYGNYRNWGRAVYNGQQFVEWLGVDETGSHGFNPQYRGGTTHGVIITVGAQKNYIRSWSNTGFDKNEISTHNLGPDLAGAMGRAVRDNLPWSTPAGLIRGRILNCIKLVYDFTPEQKRNSIPAGIFYPENIPGKGFFFMGNLTQAGTVIDPVSGELKPSSLTKLDFHSVINYMKKTIKEVAYTYLFEPNNAANRDAFKTSAENVLAGISASGAIGFFRIECDDTQSEQTAENLYARIIIQPIDTIKTIELNVSVTPTGVATEISDTFIL